MGKELLELYELLDISSDLSPKTKVTKSNGRMYKQSANWLINRQTDKQARQTRETDGQTNR